MKTVCALVYGQADQLPLLQRRRIKKWVVHGCRGNSRLVLFQQASTGHIQARHHPGHEKNVFRFNPPLIKALQALNNDINQRRRRQRISKHAMLDPALQRFYHCNRRLEIHVGNPQRQDILPRILFKLSAVAGTTVDHSIKIKFHSLNLHLDLRV